MLKVYNYLKFYYGGLTSVHLESSFLLLVLAPAFGWVLSTDTQLFNLILSLEGLSFISCLLCLENKTSFGVDAAVRYYTAGILGTILLFVGFIGIYKASRSQMTEWIFILSHDGVILDSFVFALMLKLGLPPFHAWLIDVYAGIDYATIWQLNTCIKYYLVIFFFDLLEVVDHGDIDLGAILFSAVSVGYLIAFTTVEIKRLLAYSSVSQLGSLFLVDGMTAIITYSYYMITLSLLIYPLDLAARTRFTPVYFSELIPSLGYHTPATILLILGIFSAAGLPPLPGFWGKLLIFENFLASHWFIEEAFSPLFPFFIFMSIAGIYNYLRLATFLRGRWIFKIRIWS